MIVGGERHIETARFADRQARQVGFEIGQEPTVADHHGLTIRGTAVERHVVDLADVVDDDDVAGRRSAGHGEVFRALLAQHVDGLVDLGRTDLDDGTLDRRRRQVTDGDLGEDLEGRRELECRCGFGFLDAITGGRLDARIARDAQVLFADGLAERAFDGVSQHFLAHLEPILLRNDLEGHLARAEAMELHRALQALQAGVHFVVDLVHRHRDLQTALQVAQGFQTGLHGTHSKGLCNVSHCTRQRLPSRALILSRPPAEELPDIVDPSPGKHIPRARPPNRSGAKGGTRTPTPCGARS